MSVEDDLMEVEETVRENVGEIVDETVGENVKETVEETVKETVEETVEEVKEADIIDKIKNSDLGKTVFGDDGKFDAEDVKRLSEEAGNAIKEGVEKVKSFFQ